MTAHDAPIPRKTKGKNKANNPKSDKDTAITNEKELTYGIERINLGEPAFKSGNDPK